MRLALLIIDGNPKVKTVFLHQRIVIVIITTNPLVSSIALQHL